MFMKKISLLLISCIFTILNAQVDVIKLKDFNKIELSGFESPLDIDSNLNWLILSPIEMQKIDKNQYKITKTDTTFDKSLNSEIVTVHINLFNIEFSNSLGIYINDVPARVTYSIPDKKFTNKNFFGLGILDEKFDSISIVQSSKSEFPFEITMKTKKKKPTPSLANSNVQSISKTANNNTKQLSLVNTKTIRIIRCNNDDNTITEKDELLQKLNNMTNAVIQEEPNIPPQAAIDNVGPGITIRFFDQETELDSKTVRDEIETSFTTSSIIQDMRPYYKASPIDNYLEIWIK